MLRDHSNEHVLPPQLAIRARLRPGLRGLFPLVHAYRRLPLYPNLAADATSQVFLIVIQSLPMLPESDRAGSSFARLFAMHNVVIDAVRRASRHPTRPRMGDTGTSKAMRIDVLQPPVRQRSTLESG